MSTRTPVPVPVASWDFDQFMADVNQFCDRQGWKWGRLAREAGVHHSLLYYWRDGKRTIGWRSIVPVALVCDLDLNRYVVGTPSTT